MAPPPAGTAADETLRAALQASFPAATVERLIAAHTDHLTRHGDFPRWQQHLSALPATRPHWQIEDDGLIAGEALDCRASLIDTLRVFIPWRKGPLRLGGVNIDTEWRSDWKWGRIAPHVDLVGCRVLDVGAGNGYFGWRMLNHGAAEVIGCDPTPLFVVQHAVIRHFTGPAPNQLLAQRLEDLPAAVADFDAVFSMGVLYHQRRPLDHLAELRRRLKPHGLLVLETLIAPGDKAQLLATPNRYAGMRNVHGLPSAPLLMQWLEQSGFRAIALIDRTPTTTDEQRTTEWMPYHSLAQALNPTRPRQTVEGLPAPERAIWLARRSASPAGTC